MSYFYKTHGQGQGYAFDTHQHGGYLRLGRRFKWPDYFFRGSWMIRGATNKYISQDPSYLYSYFNLEENDVKQEEEDYTFSSTGISIVQTITRDSRNHPEFPTSGSRSIWTSTLSGGFLGGNQDFHKHVLDFNYFIPLYNNFTISQIFKAGILKKIDSKDDSHSIIPPSARFIMGGDGIPYGEMLRGYPQNKIGPINPYNGSSVGGKFMLKYSLEFRLSLSSSPTIYGLSFFEMGNVWSDIDDLDPFDLKRSAGIGIRIFIPMLGMLGYDIGYGFDYTDYDILTNSGSTEPHGLQHHIIFGMPF
jgi:outer membrane protein insertion porin family